MHTFRCSRCGAASYSAATLDVLRAGDRCMHCGGELEASQGGPAPPRRSELSDPRRRPAGRHSGRYALRPSARSSAG
jgi:DNA-directed RNA polymerase subunit RPC12/RpoP